jgi:hypothetical protein
LSAVTSWLFFHTFKKIMHTRVIITALLAVLACTVYATTFDALVDEAYPLSEVLAQASATKKCTSTALNVRASASTKGKLLRTLPQGSSVNVVSQANGWAKIANGQYVSAQYLKACGGSSKPAAPKPVKPAPKPEGPASKGGSLSVDKLRKIMPNLSSSKANNFIGPLNKAMNEGKITTCPRIAAFLAQLAHESGQLVYWEELASGRAYEGRRDLGNTHPGDGVRFKGRGPIQLTGRNNYRAAGKALGLNLEANPKLVSTTDVGFRTTIW